MNFLDRLRDGPILADGAMGTVLYDRGVFINRCFDELNLSDADLIKDIHRDYLRAGAEIIETNTFGANRFKLGPHGLEDSVQKIVQRGVEIAQEAIHSSGVTAFIAGSVGPLGNPLQKILLSEEELRTIYEEQITALVEAGVDLLAIETISRRQEIAVALEVARQFPSVPVVAMMTYGDDGHTVQGEAPAHLGPWLLKQGADVIGCNCSTGPRAMLGVLTEYRSVLPDTPLAALPNAGSPEYHEGRYLYFSSPEYMATYARRFVRGFGAGIIGGCCGTTPEHVRAMRDAIRSLRTTRIEVIATPQAEEVESIEPVPLSERSHFAARLARGEFVTSVEISPPRGVDPERVLGAIQTLESAGVDAINIPDGPRASARMSPMALSALVHQRMKIEAILHYCCRDRNLLGMQSDLLGANALGVHNLIIITGDPPKLGDYPQATAVFDVDSIGLTRMAHQLNHGSDLAGNALGAGTGFFIGVGANPGAMNLEEEVRRFRAKWEAGAECAYTQPVFDPAKLFEFLRRTEDIPIPILVGILPLNSHRNAEFFHNEVPGMEIPDQVREQMRKAGSGDVAKQTGIEIAKEALGLARQSPRIRGVYVMPPFGRAARALDVLEDVLKE